MLKISQKRSMRALLLLAGSLTLLVVVVMLMANATYARDLKGGLEEAPTTADASHNYSHRLIVQLESPSLAEMSASIGIAREANGRLAVNAPSAQAYIAQLEAEQAAFVASMEQALAGASVATYINEAGQSVEATYQAVFNGVAVDPGDVALAVARKSLSQIAGVKAVFLDYAHEPDLYASLPLINAPALWNNPGIGSRADGGAGVKVASMDGGAHHAAAMFDGAGFSYPAEAPFYGSGLGDMANNNGKIIVSRAYFRDWDPPDAGDENTWPGQDGTSHGTHTASTAAGNIVVADYLGITKTLSGVAPGAWVMSYRVFYDSVTHDGSFYNVEGIAALEDILMDGADVLNNSWGGGPGSIGGEFDALDTALINVASAGTFVSMSAGNSGPGNGTTDHPSDDYINVAASSTSGTLLAGRLNVSEPLPISPTLQAMGFGIAQFGPPLVAGQVVTHSFISAASVDSGNVAGCSPWTGTPFTGNAALISRGSCSFGTKVYLAQQAGAEFVVIYNNAGDGLLNMTFACSPVGCVASDITISSIFIGQTNGTDMVDWYASYGSASVLELDNRAFQAGNIPDEIIDFSSRGPGAGNVLKPDITAPGVNILAQGYKPGASGEERHLGFGQVSGTSMASPHVAGSAALLRQLHPGWSNAYIKSALMSTSQYTDIYNQLDGSPAQPLDMGAGRLDLTHAADPGIILSPPSLSYGLMPTGTMKSIQVWVTSVATETETYDLSTLYTGNGFAITQTTALPGFAVSPITITLAPGASTGFTVTFDSVTGMGIGDNQGYVILAGDNGHEGHMPAWARVEAAPSAEVLVIDNDFSNLLGFPNYLAYYTSALTDLGLTYDVWDADAHYDNPTTIPEAAVLSSYKAVIYYTGDNYYPDGTFTVATPLTSLDMDRLVEYANSGGIVIAMGQDMSGVLDDSFFDDSVLGDTQLQDSVSGFSLPALPIGPYANAPEAFDAISLDMGGQGWYDVTLTGANEVPPVATTTGGTASFAYDITTGELSYDITINASAPLTLTGAHIHSGAVGVNGPVIHPISEITNTMLVSPTISVLGSVTLSAPEESLLFSGGLYFNAHSTVHPSGEVRGQVMAAVNGDGAENQYYIDEMAVDPWTDPTPGAANPYQALLAYPGTNNIQDGVVAMAHRDQPTLERPGTSYPGRSIYTSFGLEGVNDGLGSTERDELLGAFLDWAMDEPVATISDVTGNYTVTGQVTVFEAALSSNIAGTTGVSYRWDFGDGSAYAGPFSSSTSSHDYGYCGVHTVRVEATDSWGNRTIGSLDVSVTQNCTYRYFFPLVFKN